MEPRPGYHVTPVQSRTRRDPESGRAFGLVAGGILAIGAIGFVTWQLESTPSTLGEMDEPVAAASKDDDREANDVASTAFGLDVAAPSRIDAPPVSRAPVERGPARAASATNTPARSAKLGVPGREDWRQMRERLRRDQDPAARLAAAREILDDAKAGKIGPLIGLAFDAIATLDPSSVPGELQSLIEASAERPDGIGLGNTIRNLGQRPELLASTDLAYFFDTGAKDVQIATAAVLASRGDETLSLRYQEQRAGDLTHEDHRVRSDAVRDIAELRSPATLPAILPLLEDEHRDVRLQALNAVRDSRDPTVIARVRSLADDPSERVRQTATRMLESLDRRLDRERQRAERLESMARQRARAESR